MISFYRLNHLTASGSWRSACLAAFERAAGTRERTRLERMRRAEDRHAYRMNHGFIRLVLAAERGSDPDEIVLTTGPGGKPVCAGGPWFNMSHAGDLTAVAVSSAVDVGADIEILPLQGDVTGSVAIAAAEEDRSVLPHLSAVPTHAETILWSIKEAALKLTGETMVEPERLAVRPLRDGSFRVGPSRIASAPVHEAFVRLVPVDAGHVLSLATYEPVRASQIAMVPEVRHGPSGLDTAMPSSPSLAA